MLPSCSIDSEEAQVCFITGSVDTLWQKPVVAAHISLITYSLWPALPLVFLSQHTSFLHPEPDTPHLFSVPSTLFSVFSFFASLHSFHHSNASTLPPLFTLSSPCLSWKWQSPRPEPEKVLPTLSYRWRSQFSAPTCTLPRSSLPANEGPVQVSPAVAAEQK